MAVPKHKTSKSKRDKRRTHKKTGAPEVGTCPECGEPSFPTMPARNAVNTRAKT
jgi:large subunit ribosomal protein L32